MTCLVLRRATAPQAWCAPVLSLALAAATLLTGCDTGPHRSPAFAMAAPAQFDQPAPRSPVLGQPYLTTAEVLPQAVTPVAAPLPAATPLQRAALPGLLAQARAHRTAAVVAAHEAHPVLDSGWSGQVAMYTPD